MRFVNPARRPHAAKNRARAASDRRSRDEGEQRPVIRSCNPSEEIIEMKRTLLLAAVLLASGPAFAQTMSEPTVRVGGQAMFPSKTIVANAVNSADHTTLVAAVKAAGLVNTLNGKGPFTVFAPTNEAFADLPAGTVDTLLKPENKAMLTKVLTYHVVPGDYDTTKLRAMILAGNGTATLTTVEGGKLWLMMNGSSNITVKDEKGDVADITIADVHQSNGVILVVDRVLMPG
jgi:uncharacterized surface protein with fasciclin (FAS1) repeats